MVVASEPLASRKVVRFGEDFELDIAAYELRHSGHTLKLERIPMEILLFLFEQRERLVTREELAGRIWGNVNVDTDNSINGAIRKIRRVLRDDPDNPRFIQTVTGRGYRFIAPVESAPEDKAEGYDSITPGTLIGKRISEYRVLQLLGAGAMGVVYRAEDLKLGRQVAMKFLPSELAGDRAAFERLREEARAASALEHHNICSVYQLGEHEGQPFIVMQLLEGQTLRDFIPSLAKQDSVMRANQIVDLGAQIANGLDAAHNKGVIHRDIKPANIFITETGQAKILDFGIAKFLNVSEIPGMPTEGGGSPDALGSTRTEQWLGTPSYLSPEQVRHETLDARTDLFSLGLVLYEMATGRRAFNGTSGAQVCEAILNQTPTPIPQLEPELPPRLAVIIDRAIAKDRNQRYQSASELGRDLCALSHSRSTPVSIRSWRVLAVVAAIVLTGVLGMRLVRSMRHAAAKNTIPAVKARRAVAILGFKNLSGRREQDWISVALSEMLSTELASGQQLRLVPGENVAHLKLDRSLPDSDSFGRETLAGIRQSLGADLVVTGTYLESGTEPNRNLRIDVQVQDVSGGETIAALSERGDERELPDLITRAGDKLRSQLGVGTVEAEKAVRASLPTNPEAVRYYTEGISRLRAFDALGASDLLQKAIAADPNYALSHSALAEAWSGLGYDAKAQGEAKKAVDVSGDAPREEQLFVEGRYRELTHNWPAAVEAYQTLWNFFPDDLEYGLRLAKAEIKAGSAADALKTVVRMRELPESQNNDPRIDLAEAKAAESLSDYTHDLRAASAAALKAEQQERRLLLAEAEQQKGYALERLGNRQDAIAAFAKASELWTAAGNRKGSAEALHSIAIGQYDTGEFESATRSFQEACQEFREIGAIWDIASCRHNFALLLLDEGELQESKNALEEALRIQRELNDQRGVASDLDDLGNVQLAMGDLAGAARNKQQALESFHSLGNRVGEAITRNNLGDVYFAQGDILSALRSYEQSLQIKQEIGYKRGLAFSLLGIARVLCVQDHLADARATLTRAMSLQQELGDNFNVALTQVELADVALEQGNAKEADSFARVAADTFDKRGIPDSGAFAQAVLSRVLLAQARIDDGKEAAEHALILSEKGGDRRARFQALGAMAEVKSAQQPPTEALKLLETLHAEASRRGYLGYELESRLRMGVIELSLPNGKNARPQLALLEKEATERGFASVAREARNALQTKPEQGTLSRN